MRISSVLVVCCCTWLGGAFATGCGDSETSRSTPARSNLGESCGRSGDCAAGLVCIGNYCVQSAGAAGSAGAGSVGPLVSREGESCARRADCEPGLLCIQEQCVSTGSGEGGSGG